MSFEMFDLTLAPITIVTGAAGAGKTYHAIELLHRYLIKFPYTAAFVVGVRGYVGRASSMPPIYYKRFDFRSYPKPCVILLDEAERVFPMVLDKREPEQITAMRTIRHGGRIIIMTTQEPKSLDYRLRGICGCHRHVYDFGGGLTKVEIAPAFRKDVELDLNLVKKRSFVIRKRIYNQYMSATFHNVVRAKFDLRRIFTPKLIGGFCMVLGMFAFCIFLMTGGLKRLLPQHEIVAERVATSAAAGSPQSGFIPLDSDIVKQGLEAERQLKSGVPEAQASGDFSEGLLQRSISSDDYSSIDEISGKPVPLGDYADVPAGCIWAAGRCSCLGADISCFDKEVYPVYEQQDDENEQSN